MPKLTKEEIKDIDQKISAGTDVLTVTYSCDSNVRGAFSSVGTALSALEWEPHSPKYRWWPSIELWAESEAIRETEKFQYFDVYHSAVDKDGLLAARPRIRADEHLTLMLIDVLR